MYIIFLTKQLQIQNYSIFASMHFPAFEGG